jgi:hypothetical protein
MDTEPTGVHLHRSSHRILDLHENARRPDTCLVCTHRYLVDTHRYTRIRVGSALMHRVTHTRVHTDNTQITWIRMHLRITHGYCLGCTVCTWECCLLDYAVAGITIQCHTWTTPARIHTFQMPCTHRMHFSNAHWSARITWITRA